MFPSLCEGSIFNLLIIMITIQPNTPNKIFTQLNSKYGVGLNTRDLNPRILENAKAVAENYKAPVEEIARQMRYLFSHDFVSPEIVEVYNKLEKRWKILSFYRINEGRAVSFEEKY